MILKVYAVLDSKTGAYAQPFFMPTRGAAVRAFMDTVSDPNTQLHRHAGDFTLFEIGSYDDSSGIFSNHKVHDNCGKAADFLSSMEASGKLTSISR